MVFLLVELGPGGENLFAGETEVGGIREQPRPLLTSFPFVSLLDVVLATGGRGPHQGPGGPADSGKLEAGGIVWLCVPLVLVNAGPPPPSLPASHAQGMGCGQSRGPAGEGWAPETHRLCSA